MALSNILSGGVLIFVIIILVVFIFWMLWKILSLFGKKKLGQLGDRTGKNWMDSLTRERAMGEREAGDAAREGKGKEELTAGLNYADGLERLLATVQNSNNFNEERVAAAMDFVKGIVKSIEESTRYFHESIEAFQKDRGDIKRVIKDYKQSIGDQKEIRRQAEERVETLSKVNQMDPYAGRIMALANEIQPIEEAILAEENQDREQLQELITIAEIRDNKRKRIAKNLNKMSDLLRKKPVLQQTFPLQALAEEIKLAMQNILTETKSMWSLLDRRRELSQSILNLEGKLSPLINEQRKNILSSEAHLADLQSRGAAA